MKMCIKLHLVAAFALAGAAPLIFALADEPGVQVDAESSAKPDAASTVITPKPLSEQTNKGLAYLVSQQQENGGWGQGGGWRTASEGGRRVEGADVQHPTDVGNTAVATLALIRAGNTPKEGPYAKNVAKAVEFISSHVEKSDKESLYISDVRGTQLQSKIGRYVDTFLAALVLSELKGKMADEQGEKLLLAALDKTIDKIERNQREDGTFADNTGWASVLSQGLCSKALNRAAQSGVAVRRQTLDRDLNHALAGLDVERREYSTPAAGAVGGRVASVRSAGPAAAAAPTDAGIAIYNFSAKAGGLQEAVNTNQETAQRAREVLDSPASSNEAKEQAKDELRRIDGIEIAQQAAVAGIVQRLDDQRFIAGFGNNGGEEFLSYMNISETLLAKGGPEWLKWDQSISENLHRVQNQDGSWSGHHCITGRTFCTAAALLTLMADRAPVPTAANIGAAGK